MSVKTFTAITVPEFFTNRPNIGISVNQLITLRRHIAASVMTNLNYIALELVRAILCKIVTAHPLRVTEEHHCLLAVIGHLINNA